MPDGAMLDGSGGGGGGARMIVSPGAPFRFDLPGRIAHLRAAGRNRAHRRRSTNGGRQQRRRHRRGD